MTDLTSLRYQTGFGNQHSSEALPGALPIGRNSPQHAPLGLYAELLSGSAFTASRAENHRTWLYRRQPSVVVGGYRPMAPSLWKSGNTAGEAVSPDPRRWAPIPFDGESDFVDGLRTLVVNGDPATQTGMGAHVYLVTKAMGRRALINADGEMLLVPQQGSLRITTELGRLDIAPGQIALLPRGMAFKVDPLDGPARGYVCENFGAALRLPELGPIGSNGLANPRDFEAPTAGFESDPGAYDLVKRYGGQRWHARQSHSPFNVVAWHGNLTPYRYDLARFMAINTVSFDHPDPSLFTVLTSPSATAGWANMDFVIFPPRWLVAEGTFRPPWFHRNVMSEFMGLVLGQYDAKPEGFKPGGASLHNSFVPHGPDAEAFHKALHAELKPHKLDATLAFMFETRWPLRPTAWALQEAPLDTAYADCWLGLADAFKPAPEHPVPHA